MTDTLITVDVSSAALISRAREGQAVARENLLRIERERQERARQEKARRERLDREQADRLGRSRLRQRGKREEVAAGYVQQYTLAQAFYSLVSTGQSGPSEVTDKYELWSGNQQQNETLTLTFGNFGYSTLNVVLPAGGDALIYANGRVYAYESPVVTDCFVISRYGARKIQTPAAIQSLAELRILNLNFPGHSILEVPEDTYEPEPPTNPADGVLFAGDPASMEAMLQIPESTPPAYLTLRTQYLSKTMQGVTHRTIDREGPGRRAPWVPRTVRLETESPLAAQTPRLASVSLIAWDWGEPQLCRRLLLQLGFRPEDLRP